MIIDWGTQHRYYNVIQVNYTRLVPAVEDTAKGGRKARLTYVQMTFVEKHRDQILGEEQELMNILGMVLKSGIL